VAGSGEGDEVCVRISHNEAVIALYKLRLYEEQQEEGFRASLETFNLQERHIKRRQVLERHQTDIRSFFVADSL
jgi:hypothetical protein